MKGLANSRIVTPAWIGFWVFLAVFQLQAQLVTLTDHNSAANLNLGSQTGMYGWNVDGVNQLYQQWFWYRVGENSGQSSVDTISAPAVVQSSANSVTATYANTQFSVALSYILTGGTAGSGHSDMQESIQIFNHGSTALDLHFFQYSDFDLAGTPGGDNVLLHRNLLGRFDEALQTKGPISLSEVVSDTVLTGGTTLPGADHGEANFFPATRNSLNSGSPYTLNDNTTAGPGDVTWAFEWDLTIAAGGSAVINKDKGLQVPEPSIAALALLSAGALFLRRRH
jgi:hypothetical protein